MEARKVLIYTFLANSCDLAQTVAAITKKKVPEETPALEEDYRNFMDSYEVLTVLDEEFPEYHLDECGEPPIILRWQKSLPFDMKDFFKDHETIKVALLDDMGSYTLPNSFATIGIRKYEWPDDTTRYGVTLNYPAKDFYGDILVTTSYQEAVAMIVSMCTCALVGAKAPLPKTSTLSRTEREVFFAQLINRKIEVPIGACPGPRHSFANEVLKQALGSVHFIDCWDDILEISKLYKKEGE